MGIRSLLFVVLSILAVVGVDTILGRDKYDFGDHGLWLSWVSLFTIGLLCVTHTILAAVMWLQRKRWTPSESSMFRFMSAKSILWGYFLFTTPVEDEGISIPRFALLVILAITSVDLDIKVIGRYILGWEDEVGSEPGTSWSSGIVHAISPVEKQAERLADETARLADETGRIADVVSNGTIRAVDNHKEEL